MPSALEIGRSGFDRGVTCSPIYELPGIAGEERKMSALPPPVAAVEEEVTCTTTSSSSSSIGKNSESGGSDREDLAGEKEVESPYKGGGGALNALESLEEALPMRSEKVQRVSAHSGLQANRRGISNFYNGKSKSFASLSHAMTSCNSSKDLSKQGNAYTRRRANLLASKNFFIKSSSSNLLKSNGGGISKKLPSNSRTSLLALAVAMNNSGSNSLEEQVKQQHGLLPPVHPSMKNTTLGSPPIRSLSPQYCSLPMRSFSLTDLQGMGGSGSSVGLKREHSRFC